jgi:hypothetical protein
VDSKQRKMGRGRWMTDNRAICREIQVHIKRSFYSRFVTDIVIVYCMIDDADHQALLAV